MLYYLGQGTNRRLLKCGPVLKKGEGRTSGVRSFVCTPACHDKMIRVVAGLAKYIITGPSNQGSECNTHGQRECLTGDGR